MRFLENLDESLVFFKAMSSGMRINILKILNKEKEMNLNELAQRLGITNGALTSHIRVLEEAGIIDVKTVVARHGMQKICSVRPERYMVHVGKDIDQDYYSLELSPGQYVDHEVTPTCGISTRERIIGVYDNPAYFADPEHFNAHVVWFTTGFVEYEIPNYLPEKARFREILFQAELGSEALAYNNDYRSDIHFFVNGVFIGIWSSPGDFGGTRGFYNPSWWVPTMNQYGILMEIRVNDDGTFVEQEKVSDVTIDDLHLAPHQRIRLRLAVPENLPNSRGLTIYGRGFGNYNSAMSIRLSYNLPNSGPGAPASVSWCGVRIRRGLSLPGQDLGGTFSGKRSSKPLQKALLFMRFGLSGGGENDKLRVFYGLF